MLTGFPAAQTTLPPDARLQKIPKSRDKMLEVSGRGGARKWAKKFIFLLITNCNRGRDKANTREGILADRGEYRDIKKRFRYMQKTGWLLLLLAALAFLGACERTGAEADQRPAETVALPSSDVPPAEEDVTEAEELFSGGMPEVSSSDWNLWLVRSDLPLPAGYAPELEEVEDGEYFDARAVSALRVMIAEARATGYSVYLCSGFRSYETQAAIYENHIDSYMAQGMTQEEAEAATLIAVNYPGGSEHQLGLAADILESSDQPMLPEIGGSGLMLWLEQHCAEYGFIVRYPDGKTDITGVEYEPWHLRYVGPSAPYIMENDLCLEEFLEMLG